MIGTLTGASIIARVQKHLLDTDGVNWTESELTVFLAASFPAIIMLKPNVGATNRRFLCQKGTLQVLDQSDIALIRVARNMGDDGLKPGRAITYVSQLEIDRTNPNWHNDVSSKVVLNYVYDQRDPQVWYCYPPMDFPPSYVDIVTAKIPPRYTDITQPIAIQDQYEDAIYFYMLSMAYAKNAKRGDIAKANYYFNLCRQQLGLDIRSETGVVAGSPQKGEAP